MSLKLNQTRGGTRCPYCHEDLRTGESVLRCGGCDAPYHPDCLRDELGRCGSHGCRTPARRARSELWRTETRRRRLRLRSLRPARARREQTGSGTRPVPARRPRAPRSSGSSTVFDAILGVLWATLRIAAEVLLCAL